MTVSITAKNKIVDLTKPEVMQTLASSFGELMVRWHLDKTG